MYTQIWAHAYRQSFHGGVNTNNITESFNNVLRKRYLPLRHDTTVFALAQVLLEVVFPEQELKYVQATVKQTSTYRSPRYSLPDFLKERPHSIQGICLLNIERGKSIPSSHIAEVHNTGLFNVKKGSTPSSDEVWSINISEGNCTCPAFQNSHIPCKHMFAIFHHYNSKWKWSDLPKSLIDAPHMSLDIQCTSHNDEYITYNDDSTDTSNIPSTSNDIPVSRTNGKQVYRLQKQIEEALSQYRTLTFLTNDIPTLGNVLEELNRIRTSLKESAIIPGGENCPPAFKALAAAGVEDFKMNNRTVYRRGVKRTSQYTKGVSQPKKQKCNKTDVLLEAKRREAGRPKLKQPQ